MARKRGKATTDDRSSVDGVRFFPVESRRLVTIGPDHRVWKEAIALMVSPGDLVRIQPPHDATDEQVQEMVNFFKAAMRVRVDARPRAAVVPRKKVESPEKVGNARQVVEGLTRTAVTKDRSALETVVQSVLVRVKL